MAFCNNNATNWEFCSYTLCFIYYCYTLLLSLELRCCSCCYRGCFCCMGKYMESWSICAIGGPRQGCDVLHSIYECVTDVYAYVYTHICVCARQCLILECRMCICLAFFTFIYLEQFPSLFLSAAASAATITVTTSTVASLVYVSSPKKILMSENWHLKIGHGKLHTTKSFIGNH